jgi:hypothetical protein
MHALFESYDMLVEFGQWRLQSREVFVDEHDHAIFLLSVVAQFSTIAFFYQRQRRFVDLERTAMDTIERCAKEIQRALWTLEDIPEALVPLPHVTQTQPGPTNESRYDIESNWSAHRGALRKLGQTLQSLESVAPLIIAHASSAINNGPTESIDAQSGEQSSFCRGAEGSTLVLQQPASDQDADTCPDNPHDSVVLLPKRLVRDLLAILTRLAVPAQTQNEGVHIGELAVTVLDRASYLWRVHSDCYDEPMPVREVTSIMNRLLSSKEETLEVHRATSNIVTSANLIWLKVLNEHFMRIEHKRVGDSGPIPQNNFMESIGGNGSDERITSDFLVPPLFESPIALSHGTSAALPAQVAIKYLPHFLRIAIETVQLTPWEPVDLANKDAESRIQWKILTGYIIEHTIQMQQEDDLMFQSCHDASGCSVEQWLKDHLREAFPLESHEELDELPQLLISDLKLYATELTEYAIDALEGASVTFSDTKVGPAFLSQVSTENEHQINTAAMKPALIAVQDCARHVALATGVLKSIEPWCGQCGSTDDRSSQSHGSLIARLWKTTTESFMAKSNEVTIFSVNKSESAAERGDEPDDLAALMCYHQLELANLFLSFPCCASAIHDPVNEHILLLTFVRALDFPDQVLAADQIWNALQKQLVAEGEYGNLKKMLQSVVLTIRTQHMLHMDVVTNNPRQHLMREIVERLLEMLAVVMSEDTYLNFTDSFFVRQLGFSPTSRTTE